MKYNFVKWTFSLLITISISACSVIGSQTELTAGSTKVTRVYQNAVDDGFSGVALVQHRGEIVLYEAAGFANRELSVPNTVETFFDIGSLTKQFTAALIMALQEAGELTVTDKISEHFDDVPADKANITIHQLLTHTSGIRRNFGGDTVAVDRDICLALTWATPLEFEPGTKYQYSNAGYIMAAAIAESASGQSFEAALNKHILTPSKLNETGYLLPDWSRLTMAVGHENRQNFEELSSWWADDGPYWNLRGAGGLLATISDLLKWNNVLSAESVLRTSSIEALQGRHVKTSLGTDDTDEADVEYYGYGWVTQDSPEAGVLHWHTGSSGRFASFMGRAVEQDLVIIVLTNESNEAAEALVDNLGDAILAN